MSICPGFQYSQTSLIRSSFIRIPRHPEENSWLQMYSLRDASNITGVQLSGSLAYPDIFVENGRVRLIKRGLTVHSYDPWTKFSTTRTPFLWSLTHLLTDEMFCMYSNCYLQKLPTYRPHSTQSGQSAACVAQRH